MSATLKTLAAALLALAVLAPLPALAGSGEVSAKGAWLAGQLDALGVESKWIAGTRVNWESGVAVDGTPTPGRHTHCSAFVAAAAQTLGVYILRPPEHGQMLLANAQNEWLGDEGRAGGWRRIRDPLNAQAIANRGELVVASYRSRNPETPGHIAIVRPAPRSAAEVAADGPMTIQAGTTNSAAIPVRLGFAGHPHAWSDAEVRYYAHEVEGPR